MDNTSTGPQKTPKTRQLLEYIQSGWQAQVLYAAAALSIADYLSEEPADSRKLAELTSTHAPSLERLLQALSTLGICKERDGGIFEITPSGLLLKKNAPDSLRSWILWSGKYLWSAWGNLLYSIQTGKSARQMLTGHEGFGHLENDPDAAEIFSQAMTELTRLESESVLSHYDFSATQTVTDIGGGYGELLISILRSHPGISGVLFDMPAITIKTKSHLNEARLSSRCQILSGNFFEFIPAGSETYILKNILHDWNDEKSQIILQNCKKAMSKDTKLLIIERVLPDHFQMSQEDQAYARSDLAMLIALGGKERTQAEFQNLLHPAGLRIQRMIKTDGPLSILEATLIK